LAIGGEGDRPGLPAGLARFRFRELARLLAIGYFPELNDKALIPAGGEQTPIGREQQESGPAGVGPELPQQFAGGDVVQVDRVWSRLLPVAIWSPVNADGQVPAVGVESDPRDPGVKALLPGQG